MWSRSREGDAGASLTWSKDAGSSSSSSSIRIPQLAAAEARNCSPQSNTETNRLHHEPWHVLADPAAKDFKLLQPKAKERPTVRPRLVEAAWVPSASGGSLIQPGSRSSARHLGSAARSPWTGNSADTAQRLLVARPKPMPKPMPKPPTRPSGTWQDGPRPPSSPPPAELLLHRLDTEEVAIICGSSSEDEEADRSEGVPTEGSLAYKQQFKEEQNDESWGELCEADAADAADGAVEMVDAADAADEAVEMMDAPADLWDNGGTGHELLDPAELEAGCLLKLLEPVPFQMAKKEDIGCNFQNSLREAEQEPGDTLEPFVVVEDEEADWEQEDSVHVDLSISTSRGEWQRPWKRSKKRR